jgi:hypothetical protein
MKHEAPSTLQQKAERRSEIGGFAAVAARRARALELHAQALSPSLIAARMVREGHSIRAKDVERFVREARHAASKARRGVYA